MGEVGAHFAHLFSGHATTYAAFRPRYPDALYDWLLANAPQREQAWDVGTGNGQVALALAERCERVMATDPSAEQLAAAPAHPRVTYREATYDSGLPDASVGLVTVGQALHWFDLPQFFAEVRRVMAPGGLFAAFAYVHSSVDTTLDRVTRHYHDVTCDAYWAPEHHLIRSEYRTLDLPIVEIPAPQMFVEATMTLAQYAGFFRSWSATQRLLRAEGEAPVLAFERELAAAWGDDVPRLVRWPLIVRAGQLA
ncbi:MAG: class I SAM-dependent methyltransferase [Gemmatimonadaceae bacterium]|nr:class I SAM-dependent methyltransferase [Gemmatimonadaceae bacterium]